MNLVKTKVKHKDFGEGIIISADMINNRLKVKFAEKLIEFKYPDCFEDKSLVVADETANIKIGAIINERSDTKQRDLEKLVLFECNSARVVHTNNFEIIVPDRIYGTNTRKIYEEFCRTLKFDSSKAKNFGFQKPLFADYADTDRKSNVWFIHKPNEKVDDEHLGNFIYNNGDIIREVSKKTSNLANRITFVKTKKGYVFLGVFELIKNNTIMLKNEKTGRLEPALERTFKRISNIYPIK